MLQTPLLKYDRQQFVADIRKAKKGARILYHVGLLMLDRTITPETHQLATAAWNAYAEGLCTLVQRRNYLDDGFPVCEYYAVRL